MTYNACLTCNKPIKKGRADKKFCDSSCKDVYYNKIKEEERKEVKVIDSILRANRKVLQQLHNPRHEDWLIDRDIFLKKGFDFAYHTHHLKTKFKANEYIFCFNYGYMEVKPGKYKVIKSFK